MKSPALNLFGFPYDRSSCDDDQLLECFANLLNRWKFSFVLMIKSNEENKLIKKL